MLIVVILQTLTSGFFVLCSAVEAGTQMLELDVHMTKDKQVIVCHDGELSRCTDSHGNISDYDYKVRLNRPTFLSVQLHVEFRSNPDRLFSHYIKNTLCYLK